MADKSGKTPKIVPLNAAYRGNAKRNANEGYRFPKSNKANPLKGLVAKKIASKPTTPKPPPSKPITSDS